MLANRDIEILRALSLDVRLLTLGQIASAWWSDSHAGLSTARRRLARLTDTGFLNRLRFAARPLPKIEEPLCRWTPGDADPNFHALSWKLQSRWQHGARPTTVYTATRRTSNLFGGPLRGLLKRSFQARTTWGLPPCTSVTANEMRPAHTCGSGRTASATTIENGPMPFSPGPDVPPHLAIEFGGAYKPERLRDFHRHCVSQRLPYEVW